MRRALITLLAASMFISLSATMASATPVATDETTYTLYGRVFPEPHGCNAGQPGFSPWAKGQVCAFDFLQYQELLDGMTFLESLFPSYIDFLQLDQDFDCNGQLVKNPKKGCKEFMSSGLPVTAEGTSTISRDKKPLYMVKVTDESVPDKGKKWFVFPLSIHGNERAGAEGGTRAIEDLVTWALCEKQEDTPVCANEQPIPHPIMEATPNRSITAGKALKKSVIFFIYPNPDGWNRGDRTTGTQFFQRYNGNGVDLNRDWPAVGFTYRPYTPWSEPESRAFGRVLQGVGPKDEQGKPKWDGGIDLHGQLVDIAFSFTLLGGTERPYDKNQRILQTVKGAWADAEARLAWSPLIKPNDAAADDPRLYGVQWGTVWDTIAYTVTGALGDWIDSPIGLNADGIDNEMSLSHVSNCGVGSCYDLDVEQLHIDGNKSLIYSMINYSHKPENTDFNTKGKVGYIYNSDFISDKTKAIAPPQKFEKYPSQDDIDSFQLDPTNDHIYEFAVKGPKQKIYNGGIEVILTCAGAQGVSPCAVDTAVLERRNTSPEPGSQGEGEWEVVNTYFNQSAIYVQSGKALHANYPAAGDYRVRVEGGLTPTPAGGVFTGSINFKGEAAWPDPGQVGYKATNMNFWKDLQPFAKPGITKITPKEIRKTKTWMKRFDSIVVTDKVWPELAKPLKTWVDKFDGNLVLTDSGLGMLTEMGIVAEKPQKWVSYAGYINFATADREVTYDDPLAKKIDQPGAAEGASGSEVHRRQTYEPVPIGYSIQTDGGGNANNSPDWYFSNAAWTAAGGRAVGTTGSTTNVSLGEIEYKGGVIRIIGALLPMPTKQFDHAFGVSNYGLTYSGYQLLLNALTYTR